MKMTILPSSFPFPVSHVEKGGKIEYHSLHTLQSNYFWLYVHIVDAIESNKANFMTYENVYSAMLCLCRELTHE
jgi:hypothetical protein